MSKLTNGSRVYFTAAAWAGWQQREGDRLRRVGTIQYVFVTEQGSQVARIHWERDHHCTEFVQMATERGLRQCCRYCSRFRSPGRAPCGAMLPYNETVTPIAWLESA